MNDEEEPYCTWCDNPRPHDNLGMLSPQDKQKAKPHYPKTDGPTHYIKPKTLNFSSVRRGPRY